MRGNMQHHSLEWATVYFTLQIFFFLNDFESVYEFFWDHNKEKATTIKQQTTRPTLTCVCPFTEILSSLYMKTLITVKPWDACQVSCIYETEI